MFLKMITTTLFSFLLLFMIPSHTEATPFLLSKIVSKFSIPLYRAISTSTFPTSRIQWKQLEEHHLTLDNQFKNDIKLCAEQTRQLSKIHLPNKVSQSIEKSYSQFEKNTHYWDTPKAGPKCIYNLWNLFDAVKGATTPYSQKFQYLAKGDIFPFTRYAEYRAMYDLLHTMYRPLTLKEDTRGVTVQSAEKLFRQMAQKFQLKLDFKHVTNLVDHQQKEVFVKIHQEMEEMKKQFGEDLFFIFAFSHRDTLIDPMVVSTFFNKIDQVENPQSDESYPHYVVFAAYNVLPQFLAKKLDQSHSVIVPGGDKDVRKYPSASDKIFEYFDTHPHIRSLAVFPEGRVSLANEGTKIRQEFSQLVGKLKQKYKIAIVPINIEPDYRFLKYRPDQYHAVVTVGEVINPDQLQKIVESNDGDMSAIGTYLYQFYLENSLTYPRLSLEEMSKLLNCTIQNN